MTQQQAIHIVDYIEWNRVRAGYPPSKESKTIDMKLLEQVRGEGEMKPAHYDSSIDTIDFMRANCPPSELRGFLRGNSLKYLQRYDKKNGLEDLRKCRHYLDMLIEEVEQDGR